MGRMACSTSHCEGAGVTQLGSRLCGQRSKVLSPSCRELKHRSMKLPNEPKFKLHDYVKKEVRGSGCCRF